MFVFTREIPPLLSWKMLRLNITACPLGSANIYQSWYRYNKKRYFDSEKFMHYVQHCVITVQQKISFARWSVLIVVGINTNLSHETIQHTQYVFNVFYIQVTDIPNPNANGPLYYFVMF